MHDILNTVSLLFVLVICACVPRYDFVIEPSRMSDAEFAKLIEAWRSEGLSEEMIQRYKKDRNSAFTFRDIDFNHAIPQLTAADERAFFCMNSIMAGATVIAYASASSVKNQANVTRIFCNTIPSGLKCDRVERTQATYFDDPKEFFDLEDGVSLNEAHTIFLLLNGAAEDLPNAKSVRVIGRSGLNYRLEYGKDIRCGCEGTIILSVDEIPGEHNGKQLRIVDTPYNRCV